MSSLKNSFQGINTPLFSLRSQSSLGIGEFPDLKLLIDWLKPLGFDVIQLLPLNETGQDPSPYNLLSANALNPIYISLKDIPSPEKIKIDELKRLNQKKRVAYRRVKKLKEEILFAYADKEKANFLKNPAFIEFINENKWLDFFKIQQKIIQFIAYKQLEEVKAYADANEMLLMGDIPILLSSESFEVKNSPELFDLNFTAGAPPDMYSKQGQNWGFPIYNDVEMEKTHFQFWKERLKTASRLYHIFRIDHIVGFFRIFAIPLGKTAKAGNFIPKSSKKWRQRGEKILKIMLENTSMLPLGEDLGVVPKFVRDTMHALGIPGTKVVYWERNWKKNRSFIPFSKYPKNSLTTISTHDSEPFGEWWKKHPLDAKAFAKFQKWKYEKTLNRKNRFTILQKSHHTNSLFHINLLQEYLNLFPEFEKKERINIPGTVSSNNWSLRYNCTIEEMAAHTDLSKALKEIIS